MKKILSFVLALMLLVGAAIMPVFADGLYNYYIGESNGYEIRMINAMPRPAQTFERIGDYLFECSNVLGSILDSPTAIYAVKGEEKVYIKQAYEQGLIDIDEVAQMVDGFIVDEWNTIYVSIYGDMNRNKKLEVLDAIIIQKIIAKSLENDYLADVNDDGETNLEDVIMLQKKIAKMV